MNLYEKLLTVKEQVPYIKKDKQGFNYTYTTPGAVLGILNPLLNKAKVILRTQVIASKSERIEIIVRDKPKYEWKYDLQLLFTWVDVENPKDTIDISWHSSGVNGEEKGLGSALTYAERYFMLKQFNIPTDDDDPDSFQQKHMSEDEKNATKAAKVQEYIGKLVHVNDKEELRTLLSITPPEVKSVKEFRDATNERFLQINPPKVV